MEHYAVDCWDAEIESSYGWIMCVGIADRSTYDLRAHSAESGVPLVAHEKFAEPREVQKLVIAPVKEEFGLAFKGNQKMVLEAIESTGEKEAMEMNILSISKEKKKEHLLSLRGSYTISMNICSTRGLVKMGINNRIFPITDEFGVPLAITVDSTSSITVWERDKKEQVRVDEVASLVKEMERNNRRDNGSEQGNNIFVGKSRCQFQTKHHQARGDWFENSSIKILLASGGSYTVSMNICSTRGLVKMGINNRTSSASLVL
ncbi:hypothetical protein ACS0TY_021629 [Phlomoides rotata]